MNRHKQGTYLRFRISPKMIKQVVNVGSRATETVIGVNAAVTGYKLKKSMERQAKINSVLRTGKDLSDIAGGIAAAISSILE